MTTPPPRWTAEQLDRQRLCAIRRFRAERMREPLEDYLWAFARYQSAMEDLLDLTIDLAALKDRALDVLCDDLLQAAARYLAGPPISADDLKVLAEASLASSRLRDDPLMARRVVDTILEGLDRNRFPWVEDNRAPTAEERARAALASAALMASQRIRTARANESKDAQEEHVADLLTAEGFMKVPPRTIHTLNDAPSTAQFCREAMLGSRKSDLVIRLWDGRVMACECKVSNSSVNSVKRLNNDAAVKAKLWLQEFGTKGVVPTAVLSGVYKLHNLQQAQDGGLTLFWAHDLGEMAAFITSTQ